MEDEFQHNFPIQISFDLNFPHEIEIQNEEKKMNFDRRKTYNLLIGPC